MKVFTTLLIFVFLILSYSHAQHPVLYGTTNFGDGEIFQYNSKENVVNNAHRFKHVFNYSTVEYESSNMILSKYGKIYGLALGGPQGYGVLYSFDPESLKIKIEKNFSKQDLVDHNLSPLVQSKDGILYGTLLSAGRNGSGVLFSFDPVSSSFRILFHFADVSALQPGPLTMASNGRLYGLVNHQPNILNEFLYSFDPVSREFRIESELPENFGHRPSGSMVEVDGNLYGVMATGGTHRYRGTLFTYSMNDQQVKKLYEFNPSTGFTPNGSLTIGSDGKLYSTTSGLGLYGSFGSIFSFDPQSKSLQILHVFDGATGGHGLGALMEADDGKLYGMTLKVVPYRKTWEVKGSVFFSIDKDGKNYKVIRDFDHPATTPGGRLLSIAGNTITVGHKIYGIALSDKSVPYSFIFSYESSKDLFQDVIATNYDKGYGPIGNLLQATDGRLYGIVNLGAGFGFGGIFSFNPGTRSYTMLMPFNSERGYNSAELVQAGDQKLYGVTFNGGTNQNGVIYSLDPANLKYLVLKQFTSGSKPLNGFALGTDGNLYSALERNIRVGDAFKKEYLLYSFNPSNGEYTELATLCCAAPGMFKQASDGKLYSSGRSGIYSYDPLSKIVKFYPSNWHSDRLLEAANHKLYGISDGTIFMFDPVNGASSVVSSLSQLNSPSGSLTPYGPLTFGSDGLFYGTAHNHDVNMNVHVLFSFNPVTKSTGLLEEFNESIKITHNSGQLVELNTSVAPIISITDKKLYESEGTATVTVSLNRLSLENVSLNYRTISGTAISEAGEADFVQATGQVIIPAGQISTTVSVQVLEDNLFETRELFTIVLEKSNEAYVQLGDSVGRISIWNGTRPIIPPGGEIITHAPMLSAGTESMIKNELVIRAAPNPSSSFFSLYLSGINTDRVSITVTNLSGQILDKFDRALNNSVLTFGHTYKSGSYFARIVHGEKSKTIKLVKTAN